LTSFEEIDERLFYALVCHPLNIQYDYVWGAKCIEAIVVKPRIINPEIIVSVEDPRPGCLSGTYWNESELFVAAGLSFSFIRFFQWGMYDFLSLPMVRCRISAFAQHPEYIGREALVDSDKVDFFLAESPTGQEAS
jgi:hypothetical protein